MRLIIDTSAAFNQLAGIGRYARHLVPALMAARPEWDYRLVYAPDTAAYPAAARETTAILPPETKIRQLPLSRRRADQLWFRARAPLPIELFTGMADGVYSPDFTVPPSFRTPRLVTIHDLAFVHFPDLTPPRLRQYLAPVVGRQVRQARLVTTVSEAIRTEVIERYDLDPAAVVVIHNGVEESFFNARPLEHEGLAKLGITPPYILNVGTIEPRKNHRSLFDAMRRVGSDLPHQLVVVGRRGWQAEDIIRSASDLSDTQRVVFLHDVDNALLPSLYAAATATVYPSWYEGFGLPVLESLAMGLPTITSLSPSLVEVGGEATLAIDGSDPFALVAALREAVEPSQATEDHHHRRQLRARAFSWQRAGTRLADAIECGLGHQ